MTRNRAKREFAGQEPNRLTAMMGLETAMRFGNFMRELNADGRITERQLDTWKGLSCREVRQVRALSRGNNVHEATKHKGPCAGCSCVREMQTDSQ